jgi:arylsulfatase
MATLAFGSPSGIGRGGMGTLKVDGKVVAEQRMERSIPLILEWVENLDVGSDTGPPVDDSDYQVPFAFTGKLEKVTLTIDRPQLSPADIAKLQAAQRNNKVSE